MSGPGEVLADEAEELAGHIRLGNVYVAYLDALGERILPGLAAENRQLRALADDAAGYLAAMHRHANRHDVLGVDLDCAGCALLDRIEDAAGESGGGTAQNGPVAPAGGSRSPVDAHEPEGAQRGAAGRDGHTQADKLDLDFDAGAA